MHHLRVSMKCGGAFRDLAGCPQAAVISQPSPALSCDAAAAVAAAAPMSTNNPCCTYAWEGLVHSHNQCSGGRCGLSMRSVQDATARSGTWLGAPDCWPPSALLLLLLLLLLLYGRYCRVRELFALPRLVFVRSYGACARSRCVGAATLLGGAYDVCSAVAGFAGVVAMPAELS